MSFKVRYTPAARADLVRLYDYLLERAETVQELDLAGRAREVIVAAVDSLRRSPFIYRKAGDDPFIRELLIAFGNAGYVALFEIEDSETVIILAVRHQIEDDYY